MAEDSEKNSSFDIDLSQAVEVSSSPKKNGNSKFLLWVGFIMAIILIGFILFLIFPKNLRLFSTLNNNKISASVTNSVKVKAAPTLKISKETQKKEVIGFLPYWAVVKEIKINPERLTQLIYFGLSVNGRGEFVKNTDSGAESTEWTSLNSDYLKEQKNKVRKARKTKFLIVIKNFDNKSIDELISSKQATETLIKNLNSLIKEYQLDGINIDFEYFSDINFPTFKYLNNFLETLVKELKKEKPDFIISFDVNPVNVISDRAYDMAKIGETVDQIVLMAYDFHRENSTQAGPVAPILAGENEHSITQSLDSMLGRVAKEKIILAVPFYGYEWQTVNGKYESQTIASTGVLASYKRVRQLIENREDLEIFWDEKAMSPWLTYTQSGAIKQIYYEDEKSIAKKIELINERDLGGIGIWALGYEGEYQDLWQVIEKLK